MNYLTNYYKNLSEQLQYKANKLENLIESIIDDGDGMGGPNDTSLRNRVPPGSIPAPKGPRPTPMYLVPTVGAPTIPGNFPKPPYTRGVVEIDYTDLQREMRELEEMLDFLMRMRYGNGIHIFSRWLWRKYGIVLGDDPGTRLAEAHEQIRKAILKKYPPGMLTPEQQKTLNRALNDSWRRLLQIWRDIHVQHPYPSDLDEDRPVIPNRPTARDRERAFERWNRQNY